MEIIPDAVFAQITRAALWVWSLSFILAVIRLIRGPSLPDRVVALDLIAFLAIGLIAILSVSARRPTALDAALTLALISFLATIAFARYVERSSSDDRRQEDPPSPTS